MREASNRCETSIGGQRHGMQPELCFRFLACHMNVRRLVFFTAVKVKRIRSNPQYGGHGWRLGKKSYDVNVAGFEDREIIGVIGRTDSF